MSANVRKRLKSLEGEREKLFCSFIWVLYGYADRPTRAMYWKAKATDRKAGQVGSDPICQGFLGSPDTWRREIMRHRFDELIRIDRRTDDRQVCIVRGKLGLPSCGGKVRHSRRYYNYMLPWRFMFCGLVVQPRARQNLNTWVVRDDAANHG
jgi:hypothetical protein